MLVHACNPRLGRQRQEDQTFIQGQPVYLARPCLKKKNKKEVLSPL
jgi:hypothetical protein